MLEFHSDIKTYFNIQYLTARDHIIPYLSQFMDTCTPMRVLEVGCGEAGVLKAFLEKGTLVPELNWNKKGLIRQGRCTVKFPMVIR